jgi:hypothetical protein
LYFGLIVIIGRKVNIVKAGYDFEAGLFAQMSPQCIWPTQFVV